MKTGRNQSFSYSWQIVLIVDVDCAAQRLDFAFCYCLSRLIEVMKIIGKKGNKCNHYDIFYICFLTHSSVFCNMSRKICVFMFKV